MILVINFGEFSNIVITFIKIINNENIYELRTGKQ